MRVTGVFKYIGTILRDVVKIDKKKRTITKTEPFGAGYASTVSWGPGTSIIGSVGPTPNIYAQGGGGSGGISHPVLVMKNGGCGGGAGGGSGNGVAGTVTPPPIIQTVVKLDKKMAGDSPAEQIILSMLTQHKLQLSRRERGMFAYESTPDAGWQDTVTCHEMAAARSVNALIRKGLLEVIEMDESGKPQICALAREG